MKKIILVLLFLFVLTFPNPAFASVVINEIMPNPSSGSDWIELYNTESIEVDLSGWKIEDSTSVAKTFEDGTKMASSSAYLQVAVSNRLDRDRDTIKLKDNNGNIIDEKTYSSNPGEGITLGRFPDGSSNWGILTSSTPNGSNSSLSPSSTPTPTITPSVTPTPKPNDTPTPTPTPTSKPQSSPTSKPSVTPVRITPTPTDKITPSPNDTEHDSSGGTVLGESESSPSSVPRSNGFYLPLMLFLIGGGLIFIAIAIFLAYRQRDLRKNFLKAPNP